MAYSDPGYCGSLILLGRREPGRSRCALTLRTLIGGYLAGRMLAVDMYRLCICSQGGVQSRRAQRLLRAKNAS